MVETFAFRVEIGVGLQTVAAVSPLDHVASRLDRPFWVSFSQEIRQLVMAARESPFGRAIIDENEVTDWHKADSLPLPDKPFDLIPAIEADAEPVGLENAEDLGKGRFEPAAAVVVGDASAVAGNVVRQMLGSVRTKSTDPAGMADMI